MESQNFKKPIGPTLSTGELILLKYADGNKVGEDYPHYFETMYNLSPKKKVKQFLKDGYFKIAPLNFTVNHHSISELKILLKEHNLKVTGKKTELVTRVIDNIDPDSIKSVFSDRYFTLTEKGSQALLGLNEEDYRERYTPHLFKFENELSTQIIENAFLKIVDGSISKALSMLESINITSPFGPYSVHVSQSKIQNYVIGIQNFMRERTEFSVQQRACAGLGAIIGGFESDLIQHFCDESADEITVQQLTKLSHAYIQLEEYKSIAAHIPSYYFIITMNDERTCEICKSFEGKKLPVKSAIIGRNFPPFEHCNNKLCRCTTGFKMNIEREN